MNEVRIYDFNERNQRGQRVQRCLIFHHKMVYIIFWIPFVIAFFSCILVQYNLESITIDMSRS